MTRRSIKNKRVLLTGASSGIGRALATQLAAGGAQLLVTARRRERLEELCRVVSEQHGDDAIAFVDGDIADPNLRAQLIDVASQRWGAIDILINNAGIGAVGLFSDAAPERLQRIMAVNFDAPVELIRSGLPLLRASDRPIIVNIGSVLGHVGVPKKSEYCASKFALRGFNDALRAELAPEKIDVLWVAPNTTRSEFFEQLIERQGKFAENPLSMTPEAVAKCAIAAIRRGQPTRFLTLSGRLLIWANRYCPRLLTWAMKPRG